MKTWLLVAFLGFAFSVQAVETGCAEKRAAQRSTRKALKECNKAWQDSLRGEAADPTDDCNAKQAAFVAAIQSLKNCVRELKAKK